MNSGQPGAFETTVQKTDAWLKQLCDLLHGEDRPKANLALRAVPHALRDRLTVEQAAHLGAAQPPMLPAELQALWSQPGQAARP